MLVAFLGRCGFLFRKKFMCVIVYSLTDVTRNIIGGPVAQKGGPSSVWATR